jgi:hypothetical protein
MDRSAFIAREHELALLQNEWDSKQSKMLILYGRRRVGKTRLITHWINSAAPRALYWVAVPTSSKDQLRSFSQALFGFESNSPVPEDFSYSFWEQAFEQATYMARYERLALVLDCRHPTKCLGPSSQREQCFSRHLRFAHGDDPERAQGVGTRRAFLSSPPLWARYVETASATITLQSIKRHVPKLQSR